MLGRRDWDGGKSPPNPGPSLYVSYFMNIELCVDHSRASLQVLYSISNLPPGMCGVPQTATSRR